MSEPHSTPHHHGHQVHRITEARESHTVEQNSRVLKYTISMSVRLVCFLLAFVTHGWVQWVCFAGAILLPYVAVVIANGGADLTKREPPAEFLAEDETLSLTASSETGSQASGESEPGRWSAQHTSGHYPQDAPVTIDGSFVDAAEPSAADAAREAGEAEGSAGPETKDGT